MIIECLRGPDEVTFGRNHETVYRFAPREGTHICMIDDPKHIAALLVSQDVYRVYGGDEIPPDVQAELEAKLAQPAIGNYEIVREFCRVDEDHKLVLIRVPLDAYQALKDGTHDLHIDEVPPEPEVKPVASDMLDQIAAADIHALRKMATEAGIAVDGRWNSQKLRMLIKEKLRTGTIDEGD